MALPYQPWRAALQPASFRGAGFKVEAGGQAGGRRNATHEFPHRDVPYTEDLGRRARHWPITGYCIGPDYLDDRDDLIAALEAGDAGTLVHPTLGSMQVNVDTYSVSETRERGGICTFELAFVEAGSLTTNGVQADTQAQASSAGQNLGQTSADSVDSTIQADQADVPLPPPRPTQFTDPIPGSVPVVPSGSFL